MTLWPAVAVGHSGYCDHRGRPEYGHSPYGLAYLSDSRPAEERFSSIVRSFARSSVRSLHVRDASRMNDVAAEYSRTARAESETSVGHTATQFKPRSFGCCKQTETVETDFPDYAERASAATAWSVGRCSRPSISANEMLSNVQPKPNPCDNC